MSFLINHYPRYISVIKASLKKHFPFKHYFDRRDFQLYIKELDKIRQGFFVVDNFDHFLVSITLWGGRELQVKVRKFPSSDVMVFSQVFRKREYQGVITEELLATSRERPIRVIDAGANVGYSSLFFLENFERLEIIAVEPENSNFQKLLQNTQGLDGIHCLQGALWTSHTKVTCKRNFRDNRDASVRVIADHTHSSDTWGFTFRDLLFMYEWDQIDIFKVDIEGAECLLFERDVDADFILQRTIVLAIEIHDEYSDRRLIYRQLRRNGFNFFDVGDLTIASRY